MRTFDVTDCHAKIVKPDTNLTIWSAQNHPYAVCNASLYDFGSKIPIGTIIEDGRLVHNDGNGYGCGVTRDSDVLAFGQPWDRAWYSYLTGYNSPVQDGVYIAPGFSDSYVFDCRLPRIGIGRKKDKTFIVTDDNVTLREFALGAISIGFDTLVNLDGGGSRHLEYNSSRFYTSPRIPYNAIAFFKEKEEKPSSSEENSKCPYPEPSHNLLLSSRGEDVKWLQWYLIKKGYDCGGIDGVFGWKTWQAVWKFQKTWTIYPDGICGPNTRRELKRGG